MGGRLPPSCGRRWRGLGIVFFYNINISVLPTPMFQQVPMLPIFNVRCVHRLNPNQKSIAAASLTVAFPHFSGGFSSHNQPESY